MRFPSKKKIKQMNTKLKDVDGAISLPENATELEKAKYEICKKIIIYIIENRITQKDLADQLKIDPSLVSRIVNYRIDSFSLDKLVLFYEAINPNMRLKVS